MIYTFKILLNINIYITLFNIVYLDGKMIFFFERKIINMTLEIFLFSNKRQKKIKNIKIEFSFRRNKKYNV